MAINKREARMKRIVAALTNDTESLKHVKASTKAYRDGKSTSLNQMKAYVRAHRPSAHLEPARATVSKRQAEVELVPYAAAMD